MSELAADRHYLKASDVAERLSLDESTVYKLIKAGELPSVRIGTKAVRIPAAALDAYLRRHTAGVQVASEVRLIDDLEALRPHLEHRIDEFHRRTGHDPESFCTAWQRRDIDDSPENADLAIEAVALVAALERVGSSDLAFA